MDQTTKTASRGREIAEELVNELDEARVYAQVIIHTLHRVKGVRTAKERDIKNHLAEHVGDPIEFDFVSGYGRVRGGNSHEVNIDSRSFDSFRIPVAGTAVVSGYLDMSEPYPQEARWGREAYDQGKIRDCRIELVRGMDDRVLKLEDLPVRECGRSQS